MPEDSAARADVRHADDGSFVRTGAAQNDRAGGAWVPSVVALLDAALSQLEPNAQQAAHATLRKATLLLRTLIDPEPAKVASDASGRLLAWQVRKVRDYIDSHIASRLLVGDLAALVQRSEAHFSRAFRRTCRISPLGTGRFPELGTTLKGSPAEP